MWDSFNGTLLPSCGVNSPYISFGVSPMMGMNGMMPPVPYAGGMFPGMMGGLPGDVCSFQNHTPPLKAHEEEGSSFWSTALKVVGGGALAVLGYKIFKGRKVPKPAIK